MAPADLTTEEGLFAAGHRCVAGMDEVGRGALAGPVTVGVAAVVPGTALSVPGLTDSKALSPLRRTRMEPLVRAWIPCATGSAAPEEIDALGMSAALRLAGHRALAALAGAGTRPDVVLLDGSHDWLGGSRDLFSALDDPVEKLLPGEAWDGPVVTRVKADLACASVAAASVVAKVERDALMETLDEAFPGFGWAGNKGYGAAGHRARIRSHGPTPLHRLSWKLGATPEQIEAARALRTD